MKFQMGILMSLFLLSACGQPSRTFNQDMVSYYGNYGQGNGSVWTVSAMSAKNTLNMSDTFCAYTAVIGPFNDNGDTTLNVSASNSAAGCLTASVTPYACNVAKAMGAHELKTLTITCSGKTPFTLDQSIIYHY